MQRRDFLKASAIAGAAWPIVARAQPAKMPRIGALALNDREPFWSELRAGLRAQGYAEGQNIAFEFRFAGGNDGRLREAAAELVRSRVDVIVAQFTPAATAARDATSETPIVMAWAGDPVATGLITSLARPGGNITGLAGSGLNGKVLDIVREVLPGARRLTALAHTPDPFSASFVRQVEEAGQTVGLDVRTIGIHRPDELDAAFATMVRDRAEVVVPQPSLPRKSVVELALKHRLPVFASSAPYAHDGGLISYSINEKDMYRRAAYYVDRILKGARPATLPVELATRFELVVNLKTAKALGLTIPAVTLLRADETIE